MSVTTTEPRPVIGPTTWHAEDLGERSAWTVSLQSGEVEQLQAELVTRGEETPEESLAPLPSIPKIQAALGAGVGLVVVDGFPTEAPEEEVLHLFLAFGRRLGRPEPQTRAGDLLSKVQSEDTGLVRGARTNRALLYHTDFAGAVPATLGLLAVREAREGGASLVASAHTLHNALLEHSPEMLARLYEPFYFDRTGYVASAEESVFSAPVFARVGERVNVVYNRARLQRGQRMANAPLDAGAVEALDALDGLLAGKEDRYALEFTLPAGSALFTDNLAMLHNRRAFADHEQPERKRLLLRMWLDA